MNTKKLKLCYAIILVIVVGRLFVIPTQAIRNLRQKNNKIESNFLSFEPFDTMIDDYNNEKVDFVSNNDIISIKATKDYSQDMYDDDLYISNEYLEFLTLKFDNDDDLSEYFDDKYEYMKDGSISVDEIDDIKLNITNYNSYVVGYNFNYEDYTHYTYFIILKSDNEYILTLVGSKDDITNYNSEISSIVNSIQIN